jgi:hypothetical protein
MSEAARKSVEKKLGPRLATMSQVAQEMRAVYREARAGQFEGGSAVPMLTHFKPKVRSSTLSAALSAQTIDAALGT